ncbi:tetratricopeptide repeat protein [Streptomyces sp. V1I1]|uniref:tetratricopeptide repeat protein n=1 Tax=Streptomyces sp. V1I1 TaxID=3042272 RepID=UPI00278B169E|nr:tetratricopeptide repeat protein [Streptomyces sp. V1I1]MDQ0944045.1 hypothetical protein [Streptomyces sp. V1I1]
MPEYGTGRIGGTALGFVVENYEHSAFRTLPGATAQLNALGELLREYGYTADVVADPGRDTVRDTLRAWEKEWASAGGHRHALLLWSGHAKEHDGRLHLITHDTENSADEEQAYRTELLADAALRSGADQMLLVIDTCHSGAGVLQPIRRALQDFARKTQPEGRAKWIGVLASCQADELSDGRGHLLDMLTRVLREGPKENRSYQHEWSVRNKGVTGAAVIQAVLGRWEVDGQRPTDVSTGHALPMFRNPRWRRNASEELVEHLVLAARGAGRTEEGWFFTGRRSVLTEIVEWLVERKPGLFLVTGSAGSGKSAVLGRIATLSHAGQREEARAHDALSEDDPDPGAGAVDASLHLRGMDPQWLARALADELGLAEPRTPAALIADLETLDLGRPPVLLLDGLDEAAPEQSSAVAEQLLVPLSRIATVLLGSRDRPFRPYAEPQEPLAETLTRWLGTSARVADLDALPETARDITAYAERRLRAGGLPEAVQNEAAGALAERAMSSAGGFLFARLVTTSLIRRFREGGDSGHQGIPASIADAFAKDLARGPKLTRDGAELPMAAVDLLTALAWSMGRGMPAHGVWERAATALGSARANFEQADVDWVLNAYGRYIVEDSDGTQAVYRLYHREFVDHLRRMSQYRGEESGVSPARAIAQALVGLLREEAGGAGGLKGANPYLLHQLPGHALQAGGVGITLVRELAQLYAEHFLPQLAAVLNEFACQLATTGERQAALAPAQESADLYRTLVQADPTAYLPSLAGSLNNLANCLAETGEHQAALAPAQDAAELYRTLADANPTAYLPDLALSLSTLATRRSGIGERQAALEPAQEAVTIRRTLAEANPAAHLPDLAGSLNNLAICLAEIGERQAALAPAQDAAELYRTLADANPTAYLPDLALSLNTLSNRLAETGERQAALTPIEEAVTLYRTLADAGPAAYLPGLARSLNTLSNRLAETGDHQAALEPAQEAVTIRRTLADASPAAHLPDLASSLTNLANRLGGIGEGQAALELAQEAVTIRRTLAEANPAAHLPDLAGSLNTLSNRLAETGHHHAALESVQEAVTIRRTLVEANPAAYLPNLAGSLTNLANRLAGIGERQAALAPAREAVALYRTLADANPAAHLPNLAMSLNNLAARLSSMGERQAALEPAREAVTIRRTLADTHPAAHLPDLAMSLNNLANCLAETGHHEAALAPAREAGALYRTLADTHPAAYLPNLATSLNNLANCLAETGEHQAALEPAREAVTIRRTLADTHPAAYLPDLAMSLNNLADRLAATGDHQAAFEPAHEAAALYLTLTDTNPTAYLPNLARSLNNLANRLADFGDHQAALAVYAEVEQGLARHPHAARRIVLERALFQLHRGDVETGVRGLVRLATPVEADRSDAVAFVARQSLRDHAAATTDNARRVRAAHTSEPEPPAWLALPDAALEIAFDWVNTPDWSASRGYWDEYAEDLMSHHTALAIEELALIDAGIRDHLALRKEIMERGPDAAYRPLLLGELLGAWLATSSLDESRRFVEDHAAELLQDDASAALETIDGDATATPLALLHLARLDGIPAAYRCAEDRSALQDRIHAAWSESKPDIATLRHCSVLEQTLFQDTFSAHVHGAVADIFSGSAHITTAPPNTVDPGDRNRSAAEIATLMGRHPQHVQTLSALLQVVLAGTP